MHSFLVKEECELDDDTTNRKFNLLMDLTFIIRRRIYLYLILLMHMEVGSVRFLRLIFEEVVNNCFCL